jgi:dienelactone hydrolase
MRLRSSWKLMVLFALLPAVPTSIFGGDQPAKDAPKPEKPAAEQAKATSPPYATASDAPLDVKESLVKEEENHTQYRIEFNGIKGDRVPAFLYVPKKQPKTRAPYPAILLQYGIGGNKTTNYIVMIGKEFVARGFVVLTIDAPGVGERRPKDKKANANPAVLGLFGGDQVMHYCSDYSRAMDYLVNRADVDKDRIGFVGISWGAITGITYVAHEPRVKAMASLVGGGNFLGLVSTESAQKTAKEPSKLGDPIYHVARIAPRPLLFINVTKDQLIMRPWSESLHKAAPDGKVIWLETDHYFNGLDRVAICGQVIEFMEKALSPKESR